VVSALTHEQSGRIPTYLPEDGHTGSQTTRAILSMCIACTLYRILDC
jgi:hypothetical protein